jgi:heme/copper-type cytochrome/quinol oxidase subunit 2
LYSKVGYTIILLAAAVVVQSVYSTAKTEEKRRELEFRQNQWLGNTDMEGVIWRIVKIWIFGIILTQLVPLILQFVPKFDMVEEGLRVSLDPQ